ncbi:response regulator transcription factor [Phormidium yuhuli AB48]|uniref:Response regulator transcription factor n=1 Tax=Phormidium yuhuli AB48 TaxID=2940671 RepID=A0ABY5AUD9_9CYAN|nr:two-component system response regulator RppA [Phormidium yuhuli]USR92422.1 response regulator transcription factor [Phormidium yuhuli AB48]
MRILLVEDEPDLGAILERMLVRENYVVDWLQDGDSAWDCLQEGWTHYAVAILDWLLPGLSGLELCQRLRQANNSLPVLMLTAKDQVADKVAGLNAGADDYLVKPFSNAELLARVRALQRRSQPLQPQQLTLGPLTLDYGNFSVTRHDSQNPSQAIALTAKEFQLLEYLMQHPNQILSRDQIMNQVWSMQANPTSNVVPAQMRLLRRKLGQSHSQGIIETVHGIGYRLQVPQ